MLVTQLIPDTLSRADLSTPAGRRWIDDVYAPPEGPFVRLNMITSLTGSAIGADGTSDTLTSAIDRAVLGTIRATADAVVVGAQSVRAEGYAVPRHARLAIVTASGRLDGHGLSRDGEGGRAGDQVMIVAPADAADAVRETAAGLGARMVVVSGEGPLSPAAILAALADQGCTRVVCEGGPSLASQFAAADAIDEYCVTVAPRLEPVSSPFLRIPEGRRPDTVVAGMIVDEAGFSYLRLRRRA